MYYCYWVVLVHDKEHIVHILGEKSRDLWQKVIISLPVGVSS